MRSDSMPKCWPMTASAYLFALVAGCATSPGDTNRRAVPPVQTEGAQQRTRPQSQRDVEELELAATRLQAQIDRNIREYQRYPRKKFIGAKAGEARFARYEEDWRAKIERVGNENYPEEARGRLYGTARVTVSIRSDGSVESVDIDRSSGYRVLDQAAVRIVRLASPFAPFPPEISRDTDLLIITRTWFFMRSEDTEAALCLDQDWEGWRLSTMRSILSELHYPPDAVNARLEGTVTLELKVDAAGKLIRVAVTRSSGHAVLDAEALAAARKTALPPGPKCGAHAEPVTYAIPIQFRLDDKDSLAGRMPAEWIEAVRSKVRSNLSMPAGTPSDIEASFSIVQLPTGEVLSVKMLSSSGFKPYDEAAYAAILRSSPLPKAAPGLFQREVVLHFRP